MKYTRLLALALALCMIVAMFAGCNSKDTSASTTAASTTKAASKSTTAAAKTTAAKQDKPAEIRVWMGTAGIKSPTDMGFEDNDNPYANRIMELSNTKWTEVIIPAYTDFATQVTLMLASGDICDFTHCWQAAEIQEAGEDGAFHDMTDAVKNSPVLRANYTDADLKLMAHTDGAVYALRTIPGEDPAAMMVRMDVIGQYTDGKIPASLEEYIDVFKKAKADGKTNYPFWEAGNYLTSINSIFNAFGTYMSGVQFYQPKDSFIWVTDNPTYKEALATLVDIYESGLVNPGFVALQSADVGSYYDPNNGYLYKVNNLGSVAWNDVAQFTDTYDGAQFGVDPFEIDWRCVARPLSSTSNYIEDIASAQPRKNPANGAHNFSVWSDTKEFEACVRLIEVFESEEVAEMSSYGLEGLDFTRDGDKVTFADDKADRDFRRIYGMGWTYYSATHLAGNGEGNRPTLPDEIEDEYMAEMMSDMQAVLDMREDRPAITQETVTKVLDDAAKTTMGNLNEEVKSLVLKIVVGDLELEEGYAQIKALYDGNANLVDVWNAALDEVRDDYGF